MNTAPLTDSALAELASMLPITTDEAQLRRASLDASRARPEGLPVAVAEPSTTAEVAAAVAWANRHGVPVSIRGGGSGLSGGAVGYAGGLVISTTKLLGMRIDPASMTAEVGAGVITIDLDDEAAQYGLMFAPDPVSRDRSTVGGNIATNAGGPRCLSRGVTKDAVMSLEVVLADGRIIRTGGATRKNSTGYDLTALFIGSEGTLGIVTSAIVRLVPKPEGDAVVLAAEFDTMTEAGAAILAIMRAGNAPDILELMDGNTLRTVAEIFPDEPLPRAAAVLVGEYRGEDAAAHAQRILDICAANGATAGTIGEAADRLLQTRQRVNPALDASGLTASCDVAVPLPRLAEIFAEIERISATQGLPVNTFAHAGDGNLHPAVVVAHDDPAQLTLAEAVLDEITEAALKLGGVISGEHGIGSLKRHLLDAQFAPEVRGLLADIKQVFDPAGILTPGRAI